MEIKPSNGDLGGTVVAEAQDTGRQGMPKHDSRAYCRCDDLDYTPLQVLTPMTPARLPARSLARPRVARARAHHT